MPGLISFLMAAQNFLKDGFHTVTIHPSIYRHLSRFDNLCNLNLRNNINGDEQYPDFNSTVFRANKPLRESCLHQSLSLLSSTCYNLDLNCPLKLHGLNKGLLANVWRCWETVELLRGRPLWEESSIIGGVLLKEILTYRHPPEY